MIEQGNAVDKIKLLDGEANAVLKDVLYKSTTRFGSDRYILEDGITLKDCSFCAANCVMYVLLFFFLQKSYIYSTTMLPAGLGTYNAQKGL